MTSTSTPDKGAAMTRSVPCPVCGGEHEALHVGEGLILLPCPRVPTGHAGGTQGLTADELELVRLRGEVSALTSRTDALEDEVARLRRLVTAAADALDGLSQDAAALGLHVHPQVVAHLHKMAHDLRSMLDEVER